MKQILCWINQTFGHPYNKKIVCFIQLNVGWIKHMFFRVFTLFVKKTIIW